MSYTTWDTYPYHVPAFVTAKLTLKLWVCAILPLHDDHSTITVNQLIYTMIAVIF